MSGKRLHGQSVNVTPEYRAWKNMNQRCYNPRKTDYKYYGGRGIIVCKRWRTNFSLFLKDMGKRPSKNHSLDRIKVNGNYTPKNCRWAKKVVQMNNRRNGILFLYKGRIRTMREVINLTGINYNTLYSRIKVGTPINKPVNFRHIFINQQNKTNERS